MDVVFRAQALADLRTVMAWYRDQGDSSEARIDAAFEEELAYMRRVPFGYQVRRSPYRFAMIEGYTYFIIYAVVKETFGHPSHPPHAPTAIEALFWKWRVALVTAFTPWTSKSLGSNCWSLPANKRPTRSWRTVITTRRKCVP